MCIQAVYLKYRIRLGYFLRGDNFILHEYGLLGNISRRTRVYLTNLLVYTWRRRTVGRQVFEWFRRRVGRERRKEHMAAHSCKLVIFVYCNRIIFYIYKTAEKKTSFLDFGGIRWRPMWFLSERTAGFLRTDPSREITTHVQCRSEITRRGRNVLCTSVQHSADYTLMQSPTKTIASRVRLFVLYVYFTYEPLFSIRCINRRKHILTFSPITF